MTSPSPLDLPASQLLPCPFCGGPPSVINLTEPDGFVRATVVRCDACAIDREEEYESDAIAAWNRRASPLDSSIAPLKEEMQIPNSSHLAAPGGLPVQARTPLTVYLAGGMKSAWQDRVTAAHPEMRFLDPRSHGLTSEDEYTEWDLAAIRSSDVVFAYMDTDNPSGFGLSLEVGYARALGKTVLYACEDTGPRQKYFGMVRCCSNVTFTSLDDAIEGLNNL